jgi:DNA-binding response OmpR family regulator
MKILVVEDDAAVSITLKHLLSSRNHAVDTVAEGRAGFAMVETYQYDLLLLDIKLPDLDGVQLCQQIRQRGYRMPILMLTGIDEREEKALALNTGADDYVVKPFDSMELLARVGALLRRGKVTGAPVLEWGDLRLDPGSREVSFDGKTLSLTAKEYAILELFLRDPARIWSQGEIVERVWTSDRPPGEETVRYHVKELRKKLQKNGAAFDLVETVHGVGYRLNPSFSSRDECRQTVLVITDDRELSGFIGALLSDRDLRTMALDNTRQYRRTLDKERVDLVIADVDSGAGDVLELCRAERQNSRGRVLPTIALIPNTADKRLIERVFEAGADDFIRKPIVGPELIGRVMTRLR